MTEHSPGNPAPNPWIVGSTAPPEPPPEPRPPGPWRWSESYLAGEMVDRVVLLDVRNPDEVWVIYAPEQASAPADVLDTADPRPGIATRNVAGRRYAIFGTHQDRVVYLIGDRRPDDTYPLTRIA